MKNTLIKVLSLVMALAMIVGVFSAITVSAAECDHTKGEQVGEPVPATCAKPGHTLYECSKCGTIYPDDIVPKAKEHTGVTEIPAADANCFLPAMTAGSYCADCQVDANGNPVDFIKEPKFVEGSKALGHTFVGADNGKTQCELVTVYTCSACGLDAETAHYYAYVYYLTYGQDYDDDDYTPFYSQVKGQGHVWEYVVKTAPQTCVDGVMAGECQVCGTTQEVAITATHKFDKAFLACEELVGYKCSLCGVASPAAYPNANPEHNLAATPTRALNSTLEGMGYTTATMYKVPTCTEDGYDVYQCVDCKAYVQVTNYATGHAFGSELKFEANKNTNPCGGSANVGGTYYYACTNYANGVSGKFCEEKLVLDTKADKGHILKTTVEDPTCTKEGYTKVECIVCDYESISNYTAMIAHELGDYVYSYDITAGVNHAENYTRYQKCANCSYTTQPETLIAKTESETHVLNTFTTLTAANCVEPAYQVYACKVEGCTYFEVYDADTTTDGIQKAYVGNKDTSKHFDGKIEGVDNLIDLGVYEKATCAKAGWIKKFCSTCQVEVTVAVPMTAHKYGNTYDANGNGKFTDAGDKNWVAVPATCLKTGKTAGICCTGCGLTVVAPQITPIDSTNHKDSAGKDVAGKVTKTVSANCQNFGYTTTYYSCCNKYITAYAETGTIDATNHVNTTEHKYVAPTCGVAGKHGYTICNDCGTIVDYDVCTCGADHSALVSPVILGLAHTWTVKGAKFETCDEIGWTAHYECITCKATIGKTVIPAHGKQYQTKLTYKAPTCTETGLYGSDGAKVCTKCEIEYKLAVGSYGDYVIPALGHGEYVTTQTAGADTPDDDSDDEWTTTWVNRFDSYAVTDDDCTTDSGIVYECPTCKYSYSEAEDWAVAPNKAHTYNAVWHVYTVKNNKVYLDGVATGDWACEAPTYEYRTCTTPGCEEYEVRNYVAAINHYTLQDGAKKDLLLDCQNIKDAVGYTCELCDLSVTTNTEPTHKLAKAKQDKTCTQDGYYIHVCADCGIELDVDGRDPAFSGNDAVYFVDEAYGHNPYDINGDGKADYQTSGNIIANSIWAVNSSVEYVVEAVKATASEDGYITYRCKRCNETVTVVIPALKGLGFTVTTDDVLVNATTVTVKIAVDANKFAFNSFKADLSYDAYALEFVGAKLVYDGFAAADAVTLVAKNNSFVDEDGDLYAYVTMNVYVPNGINGQPKNVELTANGAAFIEVTFNVRPTAEADTYAVWGAYSFDYMIVDEDGKLDYMNYGDVTYLPAEIDYDALVVNNAGDVNADGYIDQGDAVAIMALIYANEYNVAADVNRDGVVDLLDLGAVLQYTVSDYSMLAYLDMINVSIDDVVAGYKLRYDLNSDGNINDTDKALLADAIVEAIATVSADEMAEFLARFDCVGLEELVAMAAYEMAFPRS